MFQWFQSAVCVIIIIMFTNWVKKEMHRSVVEFARKTLSVFGSVQDEGKLSVVDCPWESIISSCKFFSMSGFT